MWPIQLFGPVPSQDWFKIENDFVGTPENVGACLHTFKIWADPWQCMHGPDHNLEPSKM